MTTTTQPPSLGDILASAREAKGLSVEQVARETKMRAAQIREIEQNNITRFSHPSYARLFMRDYAKYLGLSRTEVEEHLPEAGECSSEGMEYLSVFSKDDRRVSLYRSTAPAPRRSSPLAVFGGIVLAVITLSLGLYGWNFWRSYSQTVASAVVKEPVAPAMVGVDPDILNADREELLKDENPVQAVQPVSDAAPADAAVSAEEKPEIVPVENKAQEPLPSVAAPIALAPVPAPAAPNIR